MTEDVRVSRRSVLGVATLAIAASLSVTACSSDAKVTPTADGEIKVKGSGKHAEVTIKGDGSDLTFNQQKIPAGFPSEVPFPKGWERVSATSGTAGGTPIFQVTYSLAKLAATPALMAYQRQLETAGFTIEEPTSSDGDGTNSMTTMAATGHGWQVSAATISGPSPRTVVINVSK